MRHVFYKAIIDQYQITLINDTMQFRCLAGILYFAIQSTVVVFSNII
jgi:hypothetical protein